MPRPRLPLLLGALATLADVCRVVIAALRPAAPPVDDCDDTEPVWVATIRRDVHVLAELDAGRARAMAEADVLAWTDRAGWRA